MTLTKLSLTPAVALIGVTVAQIANFSLGPQPWPGEMLLSSLWVWTATFLAGPILATVAAWDGARLVPQDDQVVWGRGRARASLIRRWWLTSTVAAVVPSLIILAVICARCPMVSGQVVASSAAVVVAGIVTVALLLGGGLCVGSAWGKVYGPLGAFVLALGVLLISYRGTLPVLMAGGPGDSLLGLMLSTPALITHAVGLTLLALAEIGYLFGPAWRWRGAAALAVGLVTAVVLPVAGGFLAPTPQFVKAGPLAVGYGCVNLRPDTRPPGSGEICISFEHTSHADDIHTAWSQLVQAFTRAGVSTFPSQIHELPPAAEPSDVPTGAPGTVGTYTLTRNELDVKTHAITASWLGQQITTPTWCHGLWADKAPGDDAIATSQEVHEAIETLLDPDANDQRRREAATAFTQGWEKLRRCEGIGR